MLSFLVFLYVKCQKLYKIILSKQCYLIIANINKGTIYGRVLLTNLNIYKYS